MYMVLDSKQRLFEISPSPSCPCGLEMQLGSHGAKSHNTTKEWKGFSEMNDKLMIIFFHYERVMR